MINKVISLRYARALEKVCKDESISMDLAYETLSNVCLILKENEKLFELLKVSIYPLENKLDILRNICDGVIYNLLSFMALNGRIEFVFDVLDSFSEIMMQNQNKAKARVISALELIESEKSTLSNIFSRIALKTLEFEYIIDKNLIGGIVVEIEGKVYDGSIKTYLTNISNRLNNLNISQGGNG
ncbi:MAG: ATP synthase F1 subunit delta [Desulfurella sp.]|uniref:ATP synthase F1 subunit delta n=1 Tax=Desulfurella sp. TaxID=1962857 RepID=UPI003C8C2C2A